MALKSAETLVRLVATHSTSSSWRSIRAFILLSLLAGCWVGCRREATSVERKLRLATATSTRDSGLLEQLIPPFEQLAGVHVEIIATGTGKAIKLGEMGDVDVLLVHARVAENEFMAAGHGVRREEVMVNTFELLGPHDDPAEVRGLEVITALQKIDAENLRFVSRGDESGTHKREIELWNTIGKCPEWAGYRESGQGMGATLIMADELSAYVLSDRATYLRFREKVDLVPLASPSMLLRNPYSVIMVNPGKHSSIASELANQFVDYLISAEAQQIIADYRLDDEPLFVPLRFP